MKSLYNHCVHLFKNFINHLIIPLTICEVIEIVFLKSTYSLKLNISDSFLALNINQEVKITKVKRISCVFLMNCTSSVRSPPSDRNNLSHFGSLTDEIDSDWVRLVKGRVQICIQLELKSHTASCWRDSTLQIQTSSCRSDMVLIFFSSIM